MELLIPGLLLVAFMVWASTRIKKTAAAAFDAEAVETDDFVIQKPEGFLNVINGDPKYAFEAYSKEYGGEGAEEFRQGRLYLTIRENVMVGDVAAEVKKASSETVGDLTEVIGSYRYCLIDVKRFEKGIEFCVTYKLAEKGGKVYSLEAVRLAETSDEFARKIEVVVGSFELK